MYREVPGEALYLAAQGLPGVARFDQLSTTLTQLRITEQRARQLAPDPGARSQWASRVAPLIPEFDGCLAEYERAAVGFGRARQVLRSARSVAGALERRCQLVISCSLPNAKSTEGDQEFEFVLCAASLDSLASQFGDCRSVITPLDKWAAALDRDDSIRRDSKIKLELSPPEVRAKYRRGLVAGVALGAVAVASLLVLVIVVVSRLSGLLATTSPAVVSVGVLFTLVAVASAIAGSVLYRRGIEEVDRYHDTVLDDAERASASEISHAEPARG